MITVPRRVVHAAIAILLSLSLTGLAAISAAPAYADPPDPSISGTISTGSIISIEGGITPASTKALVFYPHAGCDYQDFLSGGKQITIAGNAKKVQIPDYALGWYVTSVVAGSGYNVYSQCYGPIPEGPRPFSVPVQAGITSSRGAQWDGTSVSVGDTLTAQPGRYMPSDATVQYQWLASSIDLPNRQFAISGATQSTLFVTDDLLNARIALKVTGIKPGSQDSVAQSTILAFATRQDTFTGTFTAGDTLSGTPPTAAQDGAWVYASSKSLCESTPASGPAGAILTGSTGATFTIPSKINGTSLAGAYIGHRVTDGIGRATGFCQGPVVLKKFNQDWNVTLDIDASKPVPVGTTITASEITELIPGADHFDFSWSTVNGGGQLSSTATYTTQASDVGTQIVAHGVAVRDDYEDVPRSSPTLTVVAADFTTAPTASVELTGPLASGSQLTATVTDSVPAAGDLDLQWQRSGPGGMWTVIPNETSLIYNLTDADVAHEVRLVVTASSPGYNAAVVESTPTGTVKGKDFASPPVVTLSGTVAVGNTLTATVESAVPAPGKVAGQWERKGPLGGWTPIPGATGSTYALVAADEKAEVRYVSTASLYGYNDTPGTAALGPVDTGTMTLATPTFTGTVKVGQTLTGMLDATGLPPGASIQYAWATVDAAATECPTLLTVPASATPWKVAGSAYGKRVCVQAQVTAPGYHAASAWSLVSQETAALGDIVAPVTVTISGPAYVAKTLTSVVTGANPLLDSTSYEWQRYNAVADLWVAIPGAVLVDYRPVTADYQHRLRLVVTGTTEGYAPNVGVSNEIGPIDKGSFVGLSPLAVGSAQVGVPAGVRATGPLGAVVPTPESTTYQWQVDGRPVAGATASSFTPRPADVDRVLSVVVTVLADGYFDDSKTAIFSGRIAPGVMAAPVVLGSSDVRVGKTITATVTAPGQASATTYQWSTISALGIATPIAGANAATYLPTPGDLGVVLQLVVTSSAPGYVDATQTWRTAPVAAGATAPATSTLVGDAIYGQTLVAAVTSAVADGSTTRWTWTRDGVVVPEVSGTSYPLGFLDIGHTIAATVTVTRAGYETVSASQSSSVVELAAIVGLEPILRGTPQRYRWLLASAGTLVPADAVLSYRWLADGVVLP
ncbi:MAG: hypothetical protein F2667_01700, partial [Actinobacteria bacterium]|nr:hypothetical protein [Actinomycetota bacterium]